MRGRLAAPVLLLLRRGLPAGRRPAGLALRLGGPRERRMMFRRVVSVGARRRRVWQPGVSRGLGLCRGGGVATGRADIVRAGAIQRPLNRAPERCHRRRRR